MTSASLGSASFEFLVSNRDAIVKGAQAEAALKKNYEAVAKSAGVSAAAVERSAKQMAAAQQQVGAGFGGLVKSAGAFAIAMTGVSGAADLAGKALNSIVESTKNAQQAQFALAKTYGTSAPEMAAFSKQFGDAIGRSSTEVMQASVIVGNLTKEYGLNQAQARQLIRMSADLAAVYGKDLPDATARLQGAIRGEAEAAEALGLVLNDDAVATRQLGVENKNLWSKLTDAEKAQLRLAEATKQLAERQGAAEERAASSQGAFDRLNKVSDELGAALGQRLVPAVAAVADVLATMGQGALDALDALNDLANFDPSRLAQIAAYLFNPAGVVANRIIGNKQPWEVGQAGAANAARKAASDAKKAQDKAVADAANDAAAAEIKRNRQIRAALEAADKANDATAESAIKAIDKERKAKEAWYDEEKTRIEARRTYQLEDVETRRDAAIKALEEEKRVAKEALESQIEDQERLKKARLDAADQAADQAKKAIDAEKDRLSTVREAEDRERDDARRGEDQGREAIRRAEDRQIEDARKRQDASAEAAQDSEIRRLEKLRDARAKAIEDDIERTEAASQRKLRALDREADRARKNSDEAVRGIEAQADAEDNQHRDNLAAIEREADAEAERHRVASQALEDERDARLEILDAQLKALDAEQKAAAAAERIADLKKSEADAQADLAKLRGSGDAKAFADAQRALTDAIKRGDQLAARSARTALDTAAGSGNPEEIASAEQKLADIREDLVKEGLDQTRDAERAKLEAAKDAIGDEIDERKRAEDEQNRIRERQLAADKDAEDERSRLVKADLDANKQAEQDKLKDFVDKLEKRKQAAQDDAKETTDRLRKNLDAEKQASAEQIQLTRDRFEAAKDVLAQERVAEDRKREDYRREEDRVRAEERTAQDRFRADERTEQDKALAAQLKAVADTLKLERDETEAHFNGPNGTITKLKKAIEDSELLYSRRLASARASFEEERKQAERVYTNPEGNGLLDLLAKARADEFEKLEQSKTEWQAWSKAASEAIKAALADLDTFIQRGANIPRVGVGLTGSDSRAATGGAATSASSATTASAASGKQVQGTLGTWINDAMDITGVSDDWAQGLFELAQKESSGDPYARNASGASGLFQTIPSTFKAYRDKNLPDDIFDPVANTVAAIRYIQQEYETGHKTGYPVSINDIVQGHGKKGSFFEKGYDSGNLFRWPTMTYTPATGERAWIAEKRPELLVGGAPTSRMMAAGLIGPAPRTDYAQMGAFMSSVHPGGSSSSYVEGDVIVNGVGLRDVADEIARRQRNQGILNRRGRR